MSHQPPACTHSTRVDFDFDFDSGFDSDCAPYSYCDVQEEDVGAIVVCGIIDYMQPFDVMKRVESGFKVCVV